jgi:tRNA (cytosine38-C5)-methyltransferase
VENVVGFEASRTRQQLFKVLGAAGFTCQEFLLTPLQLGIPYSRPRYFCIARQVKDPMYGCHLGTECPILHAI